MEGNCSGTSKPSRPEDEFTDLLFSWSLKQILDEDLFKLLVQNIPEEFESVDGYMSSFVYPLLEETRAELASSLETVYKAPFAEVVSLEEPKGNTLIYNVKVGYWRNKTRDCGKEPYRTLPGDFLLLSDSKPESVSDLRRIGGTCTFASVTRIFDDETDDSCTSSRFKLRTAGLVGDGLLYVVYLTNITTNKRIWKALRMRRNMRIIEKVLVKNDLGKEDCEFRTQDIYSEVEEKFGSTVLSKLNESQLEAVLASIRKTRCNHHSHVELIWGPPGTGKTSTLSVLLYILLEMNVRTLVCAPTNTAVRELASRVKTLVRNSVETENGSSLTSSLGGLLLFGNNDRLNVGSDIEEIFLDYRLDRLMEIIVSQTGWRPCVMSMLDFLENCVSQHKIFVENEQIETKDVSDGESAQFGTKPFLDYARDRFKNLAFPLRNCMRKLITHLPRSFIDEENHQNIVQLFYLLNSLEKFLFEESGMTSEYLETLFMQQIMTGYGSFRDTSSLQCIRSQCVLVLRSIQTSLSKLVFPKVTDRSSTTEFCFQKASLMFCTISSAFKLHEVNVDPFQVLVIDEAAQVKECETSIALQIRGVRHAILVGDERQLPATVSSKLSEKAGFGRSLFERLSSMGHPKYLLDVQYRMHPSISLFPNSKFYQNQILDGPNVQNKIYERCYLQGKMFGPYSFINVRGGREELDDVGVSRRNMVEVAVVVKLVHKLIKAWSSSNENLSIGLISPYAAQVAAIQDKLRSLIRYDNLERITVKVRSIDGFQGGEEDIIIISTVRSHKGGSVGFLCSPQRTNVALTRARHCLWILGNESTLSKSDSVWEAIVSDAKDRQCFFNADEDPEIEKAVIDVKKDLDQLDDFLSGESALFKNLRWQVLFSDNFRKSFQKLRSSSTKKLVINLLVKLAGGWRPRKVNVDWKCEKSSYIVKQFKVDIYYVVCSIDLMRDCIYQQFLKVWDIMPMTETTKLLKRIDRIASMYTDDFINHCNDTLVKRNLEVPLSWLDSIEIVRFKDPSNTNLVSSASSSSDECRAYAENSKVSESLLLMKFYTLSTDTANHLLSDVEGNVDLPFEVTDEERQIIRYNGSSFILGRSGTGKTTILTMKLYQAFQQYCIASRDSVEQFDGGSKDPVLHQLFVTVSPKLCHAVKKIVSQMKSFATENSSGDIITCMDDVDEVADFKDIPDTFVGIQQEKYPLIITFHKFLMMLDGTLGKSYFQRFPSVRDSFHYEGRRSIALQTFLRKNEVTYDRFSSIYWPHFSDKLTKSLDASRVFTEIMSHIKGGPMEGDYKRSRQDYVSLTESRTSTLCAAQRCAIYDIFEDYEKKKLERGEFDLADFVSDIHMRLDKENLLGDKMDFVYIDEVQDLTMRQISLFRYICNNVDEGFCFSGDTAQTIARGIDFRFEDIRSLFYNEFLMRSRNCDHSGKKEKGLMSDIFTLSYNFRTHSGVLRLAQSIIDLICYYFPHSIDVLAPETSRIYGESPIVLESGSDENLIISIFGHSGKSSATGNLIGFGADQAIIVRDDSAKKEVSNYIGHQALILTIVECKGLEFQDVLLYNFFGSSPLGNHWRVMYEFLKEKDLDDDSAKPFQSFSLSKHSILCSELKQLYVAITRTRQRLWICENNVEVFTPMLDYWRRLSLVKVRKIDDSLAEAMQKVSTPEEWKSQGVKLLWEKNYEMATMCFEKAGEETLEKLARASGHRAAADSLRGSNSVEATRLLREAAEIFDSINRAASAAECFYDLGDYERAGRIYWDKTSELGKAGECFSLAGKYELAAQVYASGNFFRECLSACSKGNHFGVALQYIEKWKQQTLSNSAMKARLVEIDRITQEFLENCARKSYKAKDNASLMKYVRAFCSTESKRNFLISLDCFEELLILEEELGNYHEASKIAKSLGDTLREVNLLEKAGELSNACLLLFSYVISNVLWGSGNQGWPSKSFPQKVELLNRVMSVAQKVSDTFHASICAQAEFLLCDQKTLSELMQFYNASKQYETPFGEIIVVRKLLDLHFEVNATKYEWDHEMQLDPSSLDQRIARNQFSVGTLVFIWNLWKERSLEILECLDSLETTDSIKPEGVVGFCFSYFGLRLPDDSRVTFQLLNPDAAWVKVFGGYIWRNRNVATLEARHFASAARNFWLQELVVVGLRVLDALQQLHMSTRAKQLPVYYRSVCLLHTFNIAKFFLESKSISMEPTGNWKLQDFIQLCTPYFDFVFPSDPRESLSGHMISLRETELSRNLLEESVYRYIGRVEKLSSGQIGTAVMMLLGCGKLKHDFYDKIVARLPNGTHWKSFIENIRGIGESKFGESVTDGAVSDSSHSLCVQESPLRCSTEALSQALLMSLVETYSIHWRAPGYISPPCFLYLLERLLILNPHPRGFFFATKSSFVEYLVSLQPNANPRTGLVTHNESHPGNMVDFVLQVVEQTLFKRIETVEWIRRSGLDCDFYFRVLVLRLLMILCVLSINWNLNFDIFYQKIARNDIKFQLPRDFYEALRPRRRGYNKFVSDVATAFKLIGDPLVIVVSAAINCNFPYHDAVFLDLRSFSCKTDIMTTLFPKSTETSLDMLPSSVVLPPVVSNEGKDTIAESSESSEMASKTASTSSENRNENFQINWELIGEISKTFKSFTNGNGEDLKSLHLRNKVEVEEHINFIASAIPQLAEQRSRSSEDKDSPSDKTDLAEDLTALISLLHRSEYNSKAMIELLKSMEARLPQLEALLSFLVPVFEETGGDNISDSINLDDEDSKTKDSTVVEMVEDEDTETKDSAAVEMVEDKDTETEDSAAVEMVENEDTETNDSASVEMDEPNPGNKGAGGSQRKRNNKKNNKKKKPKKGKGGKK